tara:strand:- start:1981 stop:2295 length:315 start_codon:yes stop_codon:yes gene_type:complete
MEKIITKHSKSKGCKKHTQKLEKTDIDNGWWYPKDYRVNDNIDALNRQDYISKPPKFCNVCECTWLRKPSNYSRLKKINNMYDFWDKGSLPTYKLIREICPKCK